ncbi:MAG: F0F1 ATP synthase subunit B [Acidimicrobiia bacterium]|nr:F0F1 ATP synthase subunit B [Acidimicrobiia bacterium]MDX2466703.1 F0F1 ATP synthase subunit B [Acidimicrobiia bacterium]
MNLYSPLFLAAEDAEHAAEETSGIDLLLPRDVNEIIVGVIAFVVVFGFIWKVAAPALNEMLENRQKAIKADLEAAQKEKSEAASLKEDYSSRISSAREEATRIVEEARQAGESARADIVTRAETEAEEIKTRTQHEIDSERERAMTSMKREVAGLSIDVAEKLVGRNLDRTAQQGLVDQFIDELGPEG